MLTVKQYENQLKDLKTNSKPMINSLTMMAKDCIGQAELIVEVTKKQLRKVDPELKLPILYLMDSIVKNVKREYVTYFSTRIVKTFTQMFEHVMKVRDKRRRELWKLRQSWNQLFDNNTLFYIDICCHQLDPGWPFNVPPCPPSKIPPPGLPAASTTLATPPKVLPAWTSFASLSLPTLSDVTAALASDPDIDPSFKAQLLMKQKQLLELEAIKIQLELLAVQKEYELSKIHLQLRPAEEASADTETQQEAFVYDPAVRKRSLDSPVSINPVKRLKMNQFKVQGDRAGRNPWTGVMMGSQPGHCPPPRHKIPNGRLFTGSDSWGQFRGGVDFARAEFGNPPLPAAPAPSPCGAPSVTWGQEQPMGLNPFKVAAAAVVMNPPPILRDDIPPVDPLEWNKVQNDSGRTVLIDKVRRQMRFYGETAVVVLEGSNGDEPREVSFHRGTPKNVFIDEELEPVRCFFGEPAMIYLDGQKHTLKLGAPTRELYIDGDHYEACFGGEPIQVAVGWYLHSFKLQGPPPEVELGKVPRYDLLAGRVNIFVDGHTFEIFLDDQPQLLDLFGFPVIIRFVDNFHKVLLNNRPFNVEFGGPPICLSTPSGRKHFLCFAETGVNTRKAMLDFNKCRDGGRGGDTFHYYRCGGLGRGRRGGNCSPCNPPPIEHHTTVHTDELSPIPVEPGEPEPVLEEEAELKEPSRAQQVATAQDTPKNRGTSTTRRPSYHFKR